MNLLSTDSPLPTLTHLALSLPLLGSTTRRRWQKDRLDGAHAPQTYSHNVQPVAGDVFPCSLSRGSSSSLLLFLFLSFQKTDLRLSLLFLLLLFTFSLSPHPLCVLCVCVRLVLTGGGHR